MQFMLDIYEYNYVNKMKKEKSVDLETYFNNLK